MTGTDQPNARGEREELIPTRWSLLNRLKDLEDQQSWQEFFDTYWIQMFELSALQRWPVRDVAQMLGVSAARVYLARHRVGALVKRELRKLESLRQ